MPDKKQIGAGSSLEVSDGAATPVFTKVAEVIRIDAISQEKPLVDSTSLDSLAREYVPGLTDGAEFNVECHMLLDNATQDDVTGIAFKFAEGGTYGVRLTPAGASKRLTFDAVVRSISHGPIEIDSTPRFSFRMKVTGPVTLEAVAP